MTFIYSLMVLFGIFGLGLGFWGQSKWRAPYDLIAAIALPFSLIVGLLGALLLCVPHFFS